jgi:hypothetical protein
VLERAQAGDVDGAVLQLADAARCDLDAAHGQVLAWLRTATVPVEPVDVGLDLFEGRAWHPDLVAEELVNLFSEVWHRIVYGGRMLLWAKRCLGHGAFEGWCEQKVGISQRTAREWMRVARFAEDHPRLAAPLGRAGLKKALLLTSMPAEVIDNLYEALDGPEAPFDESVFDRPYVELKRELESMSKQLERANADRAREEGRAARAERTVAELVRTPSNPAQETIDVLRKHKNSIHSAVIAHLGTAELLCRDWDSADPAVKAEVLSLMEWLDALGRFEHARMRLLVGDENWGDTYRAIIAEGRVKTDSVYDLDESRILPFFGGAAGDDGKARKGPRT